MTTGRNQWAIFGLGAAGGLGLVLAGAALVWWLVLVPMRADALVQTGFAAKETCGCVFVSARPADSCLADMPAPIAALKPKVDEVAAAVSVRAFPFVTSVARYEAGYGCTLY